LTSLGPGWRTSCTPSRRAWFVQDSENLLPESDSAGFLLFSRSGHAPGVSESTPEGFYIFRSDLYLDPVSSEISDLSEFSDLLLFLGVFR